MAPLPTREEAGAELVRGSATLVTVDGRRLLRDVDVLADRDVATRLRATLATHADAYGDALATHFSEPLEPLKDLA